MATTPQLPDPDAFAQAYMKDQPTGTPAPSSGGMPDPDAFAHAYMSGHAAGSGAVNPTALANQALASYGVHDKVSGPPSPTIAAPKSESAFAALSPSHWESDLSALQRGLANENAMMSAAGQGAPMANPVSVASPAPPVQAATGAYQLTQHGKREEGASNLIEGALGTAQPLLYAGAIEAPGALAAGLTAGAVGQSEAEEAARAAGASPAAARLAGDIGGVVTGGVVGGPKAVEDIGKGTATPGQSPLTGTLTDSDGRPIGLLDPSAREPGKNYARVRTGGKDYIVQLSSEAEPAAASGSSAPSPEPKIVGITDTPEQLPTAQSEAPPAVSLQAADWLNTQTDAEPESPSTTAATSPPPAVSPQQEAPPAQSYQYQPLDTSQPVNGVFYHGTKAPVASALDLDPANHADMEALGGPGLYLTDNPDVAASYAKTRGRGQAGHVVPVQVNGAKLLDIDGPAPDALRDALRKQFPDQYEDLGQGATGTQLLDAVYENLAGDLIPKSDTYEQFADLSQDLKRAGYDGFSMKGGQRVGKKFGPHNVAILFPDWESGKTLGESGLISDIGAKEEPSAAAAPQQNAPAAAPAESAAPASPEDIVARNGAEYRGRMENVAGQPDLILFNDPQTGSTLGLPEDQISDQAIQQHMAESRAKFAQPSTLPVPDVMRQAGVDEFNVSNSDNAVYFTDPTTGIAGLRVSITGLTPDAVSRKIQELHQLIADDKRPPQPSRITAAGDDEYLHGTTKENADKIRQSGQLRTDQGRQYDYSELGPDTIYLARKGSWWFDPNSGGRNIDYDDYVPVRLREGSRIFHVDSIDDMKNLAKIAGFDSPADFMNAIWTDGHFDKSPEDSERFEKMLSRARGAIQKLRDAGIDAIDIGKDFQDAHPLHHTLPAQDQVAVINPDAAQVVRSQSAAPRRLLVSEEGYQQAKKNISGLPNQLNAGIPVHLLPDFIKVGVYHLENGARSFADWSQRMVDQLGEKIRPFLQDLYEKSVAESTRRRGVPPAAIDAANKAEAATASNGAATVTPAATAAALAPKQVTHDIPAPTPGVSPGYDKLSPEDAERASRSLDWLDTPEGERADIYNLVGENIGKINQQRRGKISVAETNAAAQKLIDSGAFTEKTAQHIARGRALNAEQGAALANLVKAQQDRAKAAADLLKTQPTVANQAAAIFERQKYIEMYARMQGTTAEAARALNIRRYARQAMSSPTLSNLQKVMDLLGKNGVELTEEENKLLAAIPEDDVNGLRNFMRETVANRVTTAAKAFAYWIGNVLSAPKIVLTKAVSDASLTLAELPVKVIAGGLDAARAAAGIGGKDRTIYSKETLQTAIGYVHGSVDGWRKAVQIMKTGDVTNASQLDDEIPTGEFKGGLKNPWNINPRLFRAVTTLFKSIGAQGEINAQAIRIATQEGLKGDAYRNRVADLIQTPTPEMIDAAAEKGKYNTLTSDPDELLSRFYMLRNADQLHQAGKFIVPIAKVAYWFLHRGIDFSPLSAVDVLYHGIKDPNTLADPEAMTQLARSIIGTASMAALYKYASHGYITGAVPQDPTKRAEFYGEGKQPYSIRIGDHWISYQKIPVLSVALAMAAAMADSDDEGTEGWLERSLATGAAMGAMFVQLPMLAGISNITNAFNDPKRYAVQGVSQFLFGFVPLSGALRELDEAVDPNVHLARSLYEKIKSGLPVLSEDLPDAYDSMGRPILRRGQAGAAAFSPAAISQAGPLGPADKILAQLGEYPSNVPRTLTRGRTKIQLTPAQFEDLQKTVGSAVRAMAERVVANPDFARENPLAQQEIMRGEIRDVREQAEGAWKDRFFAAQRAAQAPQ